MIRKHRLHSYIKRFKIESNHEPYMEEDVKIERTFVFQGIKHQIYRCLVSCGVI